VGPIYSPPAGEGSGGLCPDSPVAPLAFPAKFVFWALVPAQSGYPYLLVARRIATFAFVLRIALPSRINWLGSQDSKHADVAQLVERELPKLPGNENRGVVTIPRRQL
jgi:hypothetical protein